MVYVHLETLKYLIDDISKVSLILLHGIYSNCRSSSVDYLKSENDEDTMNNDNTLHYNLFLLNVSTVVVTRTIKGVPTEKDSFTKGINLFLSRIVLGRLQRSEL